MGPLVTISPEAAAFLAPKLGGSAGLLVTINKKGCAGGEYEFAPINSDAVTSALDCVEDKGIKIYFEKKYLLSLMGAELVLLQDKFNTRLDFKNPNEVSRCGCGESIQLPS
ncbi:MAG: iron-sulfur cluster assembly accessory protein [Alphaproteobacteria bacterium]|nr:iron-sulfur cluster assembly accessory protein [Alphaproteobacteria bacterium]